MRNIIFLLLFLFVAAGLCFADTHIPAGNVSGIWTASGSPYYIDGEVHVPTDSMLIIEPGCSIIFTGHYKFCVDDDAVLKAIGTVTDSIIFTAHDTILTDSSGGHNGIRFYYSSDGCTLSYCKIEYGNSFGASDCGGAIYCYHCGPIIKNNKLSCNRANDEGGAIYCEYSNAQIIDNLITRNSADDKGGGIGMRYSNLTIKNNIIMENLNLDVNGDGGGGIFLEDSEPIIKFNIIIRNNCITGDACGGGIHSDNSNPQILNNIISYNSADFGGGICSRISDNPLIINNTVCYNFAECAGGIYCEHGSELVIINNILWNDSSDMRVCSEIGIDGSDCFIAYTNIDSNKCYIESGAIVIWGPGNINANPLFADTLFHLSASSPCIDAGAESVYVPIWDTVIYAPRYDFEGGTRPHGADWDIGADEYGACEIFEQVRLKPQTYRIFAYPNPFNSSCFIKVPAGAKIEIYDLKGNIIKKYGSALANEIIVREQIYDSNQLYIWTPDRSVSSGIYLIRAMVGNRIMTKRIIFIK